jgi:putative FmdB family regulatory protein
MPTYEYRCRACKHEFEEFQSIKAPALIKCPTCGKRTLERLIGTGSAILFKGSGFYQTDYRSASYKSGAEGEAKSSSTSPSPPASTDSKAAPKPEAPSTAPAASPEPTKPRSSAAKRATPKNSRPKSSR